MKLRSDVRGLKFDVRGLMSHEPQTSNLKLQTLCFLLFALCFTACSSKPDSGTPAPSSTKFQQYIIHGEQLYIERCSNCHQKNGTGLGLLYPPLNKSDFVDGNFEHVVCVIKNGIEGELIVNGKSFNKKMPAIPTLTDLDVAEIATYIYNTWGRERGIVEVNEASRILGSCDSLTVNR